MRRAAPGTAQIIMCGVQYMFQQRYSAPGIHNIRSVPVCPSPIIPHIGPGAGGVWEPYPDMQSPFSYQWRTHPYRDQILTRMRHSDEFDGNPFQREPGSDLPRPHIQFLVNLHYILNAGLCPIFFYQFESDIPQLKTMRVLSEPIGRILVPFRFVPLNGIADLPSVYDIFFHRLFQLEMAGIYKAMPAPFRLCPQRYPFFIIFREGLQPGDVYREGKPAIAHR